MAGDCTKSRLWPCQWRAPSGKPCSTRQTGFAKVILMHRWRFPEDDPDIMLIVLRIIHFKFDDLPPSISFDWLVELAVFCDKYDTVSIVRPFIANWTSPWMEFCLEPGYEHWLSVAWTFGCQEIFSTLAASLVLSTGSDNDDDDQNTIEASNNWVHSEGMPPNIVANILKVREDTIGKLLDLFDDTTKSLVANEGCTKSKSLHNGTLCNTALLGLFLQSLYPIGLGLGPQKMPAAKVRSSISMIARTFNTSPQLQYKGKVVTCNLSNRLEPKISKILQEIPSAVMENHMRHMEDQAKKSGIGYLKIPETKTKMKAQSANKLVFKESDSSSDSDSD